MSKAYLKTLLATVTVAVSYLFLFFFVDREVAMMIHTHLQDSWLMAAGKVVSAPDTGSYIKLILVAIFITIFVFDPGISRTTTKKLLFICISLSVAISIGEGAKYLLARYRPVMFFEEQLYGLHYFSTKWELNSTPSGHTYRAFAFFTALSLLYKRYMPLFLFAALLIGVSRVVVTAHYPSDVLFGAFIGIVTAGWMHRILYDKNLEKKE